MEKFGSDITLSFFLLEVDHVTQSGHLRKGNGLGEHLPGFSDSIHGHICAFREWFKMGL
jgi:hypothetical protein